VFFFFFFFFFFRKNLFAKQQVEKQARKIV